MTNLRPIWLRTILAWLLVPAFAALLLPMVAFVSVVAFMRDGRRGFVEVWVDVPFLAARDLLLGVKN